MSTQATAAYWPASLIHAQSPAQLLAQSAYEASGVTVEQYAKKVLAYANCAREQARRVLVARRRAMLTDAWAPLLVEHVKSWVRPEVADAVLGTGNEHADIGMNAARDIWRELAVLYQQEARRTTTPPAAGEAYLRLVGDEFDQFWDQVEVALEAFNDVVIWPTVIERNGEKVIRHRWAAGDCFTVVLDEEDPGVVDALVFHDEFTDLDGKRHARSILWSDAFHAVFNAKGDIVGGGFEGMNPYGRLPHVALHLLPSPDDFWENTAGEDLVNLTLTIGSQRTFANYAWKMNSFKQLVVVGDRIESKEQQLLDPAAILRIQGQNVTATIADWQVNFDQRRKWIDADMAMAAAARGINPERLKRTANYQTAQGARLGDRGLEERRRRKSKILRAAERAYYRSVCLVAKVHGFADVPDPAAVLDVRHAPMEYLEDPLQRLEYYRQAVEMGVESLVGLVQTMNPTWTEQQCRDFLAQTKGTNGELGPVQDSTETQGPEVSRETP